MATDSTSMDPTLIAPAPPQGGTSNAVQFDTGRDNPNSTQTTDGAKDNFASSITQPEQAKQGSGFGQQFAAINQLIAANQGSNPYSGAQAQTDQYTNTLRQDQRNVIKQAGAVDAATANFNGAGQFVQNVIANPTAFVYGQGNNSSSPNSANINQFSTYYNGTQPTFNDLTAAQQAAQKDYNNFKSFGQMTGTESGRQQINAQSAGPNQYTAGMNSLDTILQNSNPQALGSFQQNINNNIQNYNNQLQNQNQAVQGQLNNLQQAAQNTAQQTQQAVANAQTQQQTAAQQALSNLQQQDTTLQQNLASGAYNNPNANVNGLTGAQAQALLGLNSDQFTDLSKLTSGQNASYTDPFGFNRSVSVDPSLSANSLFLPAQSLNINNAMTADQAQTINALNLLSGQGVKYSDLSQFKGPNLGTVDTSQLTQANVDAQNAQLQSNLASSQAAQQQAYNQFLNDRWNAIQNTRGNVDFNAGLDGKFGSDAAKQAALQQLNQRWDAYVKTLGGGASDNSPSGGDG